MFISIIFAPAVLICATVILHHRLYTSWYLFFCACAECLPHKRHITNDCNVVCTRAHLRKNRPKKEKDKTVLGRSTSASLSKMFNCTEKHPNKSAPTFNNRKALYLIIAVWCLRVCGSSRFTNRLFLFIRIHTLSLGKRQQLLQKAEEDWKLKKKFKHQFIKNFYLLNPLSLLFIKKQENAQAVIM